MFIKETQTTNKNSCTFDYTERNYHLVIEDGDTPSSIEQGKKELEELRNAEIKRREDLEYERNILWNERSDS